MRFRNARSKMLLLPFCCCFVFVAFVSLLFYREFVVQANSSGLKKFEVFWAVPSQPCAKSRGLDPTEFGIRTNAGQRFHGSEVVVFYEQNLGLYPRIFAEHDPVSRKWRPGAQINQGLPQSIQRANLREHLEKAGRDITRAIPDPNFAGLAVIDYEHWRPLYTLNWHSRVVYKLESTRDALTRHPNISEKAAYARGRDLFDKAAKTFMVSTIRLGRKLRPRARWGFYDYPLCNYDVGRDAFGLNASISVKTRDDEEMWERRAAECRPKFTAYNERLSWLFAESDALFPPIYLYEDDDFGERSGLWQQRYVHARVHEAELVRQRLRRRPEDLAIVPFTKFEYNTDFNDDGGEKQPILDTSNFYSKADLCNTLDYAGGLAVDGLVFWSSSAKMKRRCTAISNYLQTTLGPSVRSILKGLNACAERNCFGAGRCVLQQRLPPAFASKCRRRGANEEENGEDEERNWYNWECLCEAGRYGEQCDFD